MVDPKTEYAVAFMGTTVRESAFRPSPAKSDDVGGSGHLVGASEILLVTPSPGTLRAGAEWVVIKNWLEGSRSRWGSARVLTPAGYLDDEQIRLAAWGKPGRPNRQTSRGTLSRIIETAAKDVRSALLMSRFDRSVHRGPTRTKPLFIWQYHSLFQKAGLSLGRRLSCPTVLYVAAPQVWEAAAWGVKRPIWGSLVERWGETPQFAEADLVACLSQEVADAVIARGADPDRVILTPCTADSIRNRRPSTDMRESLGLDEVLVVGWVGSFRAFHNAEMLVRVVGALQGEREIALIMIGDGPTRAACEGLAADLGLKRTFFPGSVPHDQMGDWLAAIDVAVITTKPASQFHYSPLKLKEYLAAGRAVVAPSIGEIARLFKDGVDLAMYSSGDESEMAHAVSRILDDSTVRDHLGRSGRATYDRMFTMDRQLDMVVERLGLPLFTQANGGYDS